MIGRKATVVALIVALTVTPGLAAGLAQSEKVTGHPGLDVSVPDNRVVPGEETALQVVLFNDGNVTNGSLSRPQLESRVTTARAIRATVEEHDAPITVRTNEQAVATLPDGASAPLTFRIAVDEDADPGTYTLPVNVSYNYTRSVDPQDPDDLYNRTNATRTFDVELEIEDTAQFAVVNVSSRARVGATGTVAVTYENTGSDPAYNATVAATSQNGDLTFAASASASRYVGGRWDPGERRTVEYRVRSAPTAAPQNYTFSSTLTYENGDGNARRSESLSFGVRPEPEQQFSVVGVESAVVVGRTGTVNLTVRNEGPLAVRDATVTVSSTSADVAFGGSPSTASYVGRWAANETRTIQVETAAAPGAAVRDYSLSAQVSYEDREDDPGSSSQLSFGVRPDPEQQFTVVDVESGLAVGTEDTVAVTLRNDGPLVARDASVTITSSSADLVFGESASATQFVGRWQSGATRTVRVEATATPDASVRNYSLSAQVSFEDRDGDAGASGELRFGVRPAPDPYEFAVGEVTSTLRVGEEGTVTGRITNTGNRTAESVVVVFETQAGSVSVDDPQYPVGSLDPGESATFEFDAEVSDSAAAGPRQLTFRAQYRNEDDEQRQSDGIDLLREVGPEGDRFAVEAANGTVQRGGTTLFKVTVTNNGTETVTDLSAKLFADSPIDVEESEAFAGRLGPGESTTLTFEVSAGGGALAKRYPAQLDFQFTDSDGDTELSDTYRLPVSVTERETSDDGGGPPVVPIVVVVALALVLAALAYRRYG